MNKENTIEEYIVKDNLDMNKLMEDYYNYIRTIIKNTNSLSIEDEEEVISDVLLIIWKNKNKLDRKSKFSPYIAGVTKNVIYRKYKEIRDSVKNIEHEYDEEIESNFDINKIIEQKEINDCIMNNLKEIGNTEYDIFTKFYYEGKKVKQIAKELNLSVSNVKTKLHRTRKKIKQILKIGGF